MCIRWIGLSLPFTRLNSTYGLDRGGGRLSIRSGVPTSKGTSLRKYHPRSSAIRLQAASRVASACTRAAFFLAESAVSAVGAGLGREGFGTKHSLGALGELFALRGPIGTLKRFGNGLSLIDIDKFNLHLFDNLEPLERGAGIESHLIGIGAVHTASLPVRHLGSLTSHTEKIHLHAQPQIGRLPPGRLPVGVKT